MIRAISEDTRITVGVMALVIGAATWLTTLHFDTVSNAKEITTLSDKEQTHAKEFEEIRTRLTHIEDMLKDEYK